MGSGLLKKANLLSQDKGLAFSSFIQKYNNKVFAIFSKFDNFYFISNSLGFDGNSILASYSTQDFWNGVIPSKNKVYNFLESDNSLNKMLQFFSFEMKDKIKSVSVTASDNKIILLCNETISDTFLHDVALLKNEDKDFDISTFDQNLTKKYQVNKICLSFTEAISAYSSLKLKNKPELSNYFISALTNEINNRLNIIFSKPNICVKTKSNSNNIFIFTLNEINTELLLNHLILNIQDVINNSSELIEFNYLGIAETYNDIIEFLKVE